MILLSWIFLGLQGVIVIASLLGYGIFTARPELLGQVDPGARFFTWAFYGFAVGNMLFGGLAVLSDAFLANRQKAALAFLVVYIVSLTSELLGTTYGVPFGPYSYTTLLGPKWFDRVPLLIPLSWFTVSWAAWVIARQRSAGLTAVCLATSLLVAWDLLLDPAMSKVTSYWVWGETGNYYGMPWTNLVGWGVTGIVLLFVIYKFVPVPHGGVRFSIWVYILNFALPLGFCMLNGYWVAVLAGLGSVGSAFLILGRNGQANESNSFAHPSRSSDTCG